MRFRRLWMVFTRTIGKTLTLSQASVLCSLNCLTTVRYCLHPLTCCWLLVGGPKIQSYGNNSGKPQTVRTKFGSCAQVKGDNGQEIFGAFCPVGAKYGVRTTPAEPVFYLFRTQRTILLIWLQHVNQCPREMYRKGF